MSEGCPLFSVVARHVFVVVVVVRPRYRHMGNDDTIPCMWEHERAFPGVHPCLLTSIYDNLKLALGLPPPGATRRHLSTSSDGDFSLEIETEMLNLEIDSLTHSLSWARALNSEV